MGLIGGIWMALLGVLAAPSLILSKRPDAKQMLDKITPFQGWIGAISALWGIWSVISWVLNMGWMLEFFIYGITYLAVGVMQTILGLLLGVGVLKTFIKNPQAQEKMDQTIAKLAPKQGLFGLIGIILGGWMIVANFLFI